MSRRLLVVDDSAPMQRLIGKILTNCGWELVGEAADGEEAVAMHKELRPNAVTMDIAMPGMDGLSALRQIIEFDPDAKVVIVSAMNQSSRICEAMSLGARDFIAKPFAPRQLEHVMAQCLKNRQAARRT